VEAAKPSGLARPNEAANKTGHLAVSGFVLMQVMIETRGLQSRWGFGARHLGHIAAEVFKGIAQNLHDVRAVVRKLESVN
jgi:hypothetical protein